MVPAAATAETVLVTQLVETRAMTPVTVTQMAPMEAVMEITETQAAEILAVAEPVLGLAALAIMVLVIADLLAMAILGTVRALVRRVQDLDRADLEAQATEEEIRTIITASRTKSGADD